MSRAEMKSGTTHVYQPQNPLLKWVEKRLPIVSLFHAEFIASPTPRNLNYWWAFGAILTFMLGAQIATGIVLAMHYTPHADLAFKSVEQIMRDVDYGWLLHYLHSNGASMFFVAVYVHMPFVRRQGRLTDCSASSSNPMGTALVPISVEKREPASDIDTAVADSLKVLERPIREADITSLPHMVATG